MKLIIDTEAKTIVKEVGQSEKVFELYSKEAFEIVSEQWLKIGWSQKYSYTFSWQGRPIIQLPEDLMRIQEVIYAIQPDVIIETGIAHGGSLIFYASLCRLIGKGKIVGIDIEIRNHNRIAIEAHELYPFITLIEGSSIAPSIVERVKSMVQPEDKVLILLDSNHTKAHVLQELNAYADMVSSGSYIIATDGIMKDLNGIPGSKPDWVENNPFAAAQDFLKSHREFMLDRPKWPFNESNGLTNDTTYWPGAWLRKK